MLTVQYPPAAVTVHYQAPENAPIRFPAGFFQVRGFLVDHDGYIVSEVSVPHGAEVSGVITVYLPAHMKSPRWDGNRWIETHGWYRRLWTWFKGLGE